MNEWTNTFRQEIEGFKDTIAAFDRGELDRKAYKGVSGGMGSYAQREDGKHMLRLRITAGRMNLDQLKFLADTVEREQVKKLKLTTCQTIQLHDLAARQVPVVIEEAIGCEIYTKGGGGDNPRNVMCSPLSGVQPGEYLDVFPWAEAVGRYLLSICRDIHMPRKLKVAFSNGADDSVHSAFRDMGFQANPDGKTFTLRIAGGLGAVNPAMGVLVREDLPAQDVLYAVRAMVDTFCRHGNYQNRAKARTRHMQDTLGADGLRDAWLSAFDQAKAAGGLDLDLTPAPVDKAGDGEIADPRAIPQKQPGLYAVKYHPIGGLLPVEKPRRLYELLKDMPQAEVRVAPDETLYVVNLTAVEAAKVLEATADGARTQFEYSTACIGASVCQQGVRDSQSALQAMVDAVRAADLPDGALPRICVSGCPSSCAAHQAGAIGLQGGVKPVDKAPQPAFRLFLGGSDRVGKARFGEFAATILEKDLPALMVELGRAAAAAGQDWQSWSEAHPQERDAIIAKYN